MSRPDAILFVIAALYPFLSFVLLRWCSGVAGIPGIGDWVLFSFVAPFTAAAAALAAKLGGARLPWGGVVMFAAWMAAVGWCHHWFVTSIWAVI